MSNYIVTDSALTSIADAIRGKMRYKNLLDPDTLIAKAKPNTKYVVSADVVWDGVHNSALTLYEIVSQGVGGIVMDGRPTPASGKELPVDLSITTGQYATGIRVQLTDGPEITNIQAEEGETKTEYEPYPKFVFPNGFVSGIGNLAADVEKYEESVEVPFWTGSVTVAPGDSYKFCSWAPTKLNGLLVEIVDHPYPEHADYEWTINESENAVYVTNNSQDDLVFYKSASTYPMTVKLIKGVIV